MNFDAFVETFVNEHVLFTEALKGIFLANVVAGSLTPAGLKDLELRAYRAAKTYYTRASHDLSSYTNNLALDGGSEQLEASLRQRGRDVEQAVRFIVLENVKAVITAAKNRALGAATARNIEKTAEFVKGPDGRTWSAEKLVRTVVRDFAYQSQTDLDIDGILLDGETSVVIKYDVPGEREYENKTISIEDFAALRPKIFHINSSARVSANV